MKESHKSYKVPEKSFSCCIHFIGRSEILWHIERPKTIFQASDDMPFFKEKRGWCGMGEERAAMLSSMLTPHLSHSNTDPFEMCLSLESLWEKNRKYWVLWHGKNMLTFSLKMQTLQFITITFQ